MDIFKEANNKEATAIDWNCPQYVKRGKGDGEMLRRLARHKLKDELRKELNKNGI